MKARHVFALHWRDATKTAALCVSLRDGVFRWLPVRVVDTAFEVAFGKHDVYLFDKQTGRGCSAEAKWWALAQAGEMPDACAARWKAALHIVPTPRARRTSKPPASASLTLVLGGAEEAKK